MKIAKTIANQSMIGIELTVESLAEATRVDKYLAKAYPTLSRSLVASYCKRKLVRIKQGAILAAGDLLKGGEELRLDFEITPIQADGGKVSGELGIKVVFKDEFIAVINKPSGMPSVTLSDKDPVTVADNLLKLDPDFYSASPDKRESGLIHRLDNESSGLMIASLTSLTWTLLRQQLKAGEIKKSYQCLVEGMTNFKNFSLTLFMEAKGPRVRVKTDKFNDATETNSNITTTWSGKVGQKQVSIVNVEAAFAKRHQVRAHLAFLGYPLVGDSLYGSNFGLSEIFSKTKRQFILHANHLRFMHPADLNQELSFDLEDNLLLELREEGK